MVVKAAQLLEYGAATHPVGGGAITPGCQGLGKAEKALIIRKDRPFSFSFFEEADTSGQHARIGVTSGCRKRLFEPIGRRATISVRERYICTSRMRQTAVACRIGAGAMFGQNDDAGRSEEHTSELQSLMRISYAVFCLKKKKKNKKNTDTINDIKTYNRKKLK